jgi:hypothetical protein
MSGAPGPGWGGVVVRERLRGASDAVECLVD